MTDALYYLEHSSQQLSWVGTIICLSLPMKKLEPREGKQFFQVAGRGRGVNNMALEPGCLNFPTEGNQGKWSVNQGSPEEQNQ